MNKKVYAQVQSPARNHHLRKGYGFSLKEIEEAGLTLEKAKQIGMNIDYRRRTSYDSNIEKLKGLEIPEKEKRPKREPFTKRIKKKEQFKPQKVSKIKEKEVKKEQVKEEEFEIPEGEPIPLTELTGLGPKTEEKFHELGVMSVQDLLKEKPEDLATLIHGCSEDGIADWQKEGKSKLKK
jgi:predicted flap endonuclease-1-like 5' DNA nuclease